MGSLAKTWKPSARISKPQRGGMRPLELVYSGEWEEKWGEMSVLETEHNVS